MLTSSNIKKKTILPIPYGWYCVAYSDELSEAEVKPVHYFGEELVLYRTPQGQACLTEAYCPHLGAHLGYGGTVDDDLVIDHDCGVKYGYVCGHIRLLVVRTKRYCDWCRNFGQLTDNRNFHTQGHRPIQNIE